MTHVLSFILHFAAARTWLSGYGADWPGWDYGRVDV
ncbi:hypothetical protein SM11_pD1083 (plasmid) [Sinorhizobium meliloti SM11]|uniref:Uncharacterized protein n=1 Tax=Sinorhizobium meliloti (strain SM11) TaxID=707241 RepID=F7XH89_SINMM|nr:hypothetical protein SM11_pD1083 [Sinorhizobium meliloti SM11]